jgi:hypothetical protein
MEVEASKRLTNKVGAKGSSRSGGSGYKERSHGQPIGFKGVVH